jgi:glycosyltransferase involved in cell wall biosynthesis
MSSELPNPLSAFEVDDDTGKSDLQTAEEGENYTGSTSPAKYKRGVVYRGAYEDPNQGISNAVRRHARALYDAGVPVHLQSIGHRQHAQGAWYSDLDPEVLDQVGMLTEATFETPAVTIHHIAPTLLALEEIVFPRRLMRYSPDGAARVRVSSIINTVFERDLVSSDIAGLLNQVGQVWVPCVQNEKMLVKSGVDARKIRVVPHPYPDNDPFLIPVRPFRFLHIGKWEPRKDQHTLIGAFFKAFFPTQNIELVLKCSSFGIWKDYPASIGHSVLMWLEDKEIKARGWTQDAARRAIVAFTKRMPREDLAKLYQECDVYVSCAHAEGFDLPAFDAKLAGLPMVFVPFGGPQDFATATDIRVQTTSFTPCHPGYEWGNAEWAQFDWHQMADALGMAYNIHGLAPLDRAKYSTKSIGALMKQCCGQLVESLGGDFSDVQR